MFSVFTTILKTAFFFVILLFLCYGVQYKGSGVHETWSHKTPISQQRLLVSWKVNVADYPGGAYLKTEIL